MEPYTKIIEEKYKINNFLVAEAPTYETLFNDKFFFAQICYAEYDGWWAFGVHYSYKGAGAGCGIGGSKPNFSPIKHSLGLFTTKEAARTAAVIQLLTRHFIKDHPYGNPVKPVREALFAATTSQLKLFDL